MRISDWSSDVCSSDLDPETRPCPRVVVLNDAAKQVKFNGQGRDLTDVLFEASIDTRRLVCEYDENVLDVDLQVERSEGRRGGEECGSTCRSQWSPVH